MQRPIALPECMKLNIIFWSLQTHEIKLANLSTVYKLLYIQMNWMNFDLSRYPFCLPNLGKTTFLFLLLTDRTTYIFTTSIIFSSW